MFTTVNIPIAVLTDSYKASFPFIYPDATEMVAYGEFRKSFMDLSDERIVFYGIRYIVETYLNYQWTLKDVELAEKFYSTHNAGYTPYPFPKDLFLDFIKENNGYFPITLECLPEGSVVHPHVPVYQITAKGKYSRLVTFFETLLTQVWAPSNTATLSRLARQKIQEAFDISVDSEFMYLIDYKLHDFGARACTCLEQSVLNGAAHLLNFAGSDTMSAGYFVQYYRNNGKPIACSIPATEHSSAMSWHSELEYANKMVELYGSGLFATVADTYDYDNYLNTVVPKIAEEVKRKGGTLVIRPDSGDPVECVIMGLVAAEKAFGYTLNAKGYKVLNNSAVIQGDGLDYFKICNILDAVVKNGFSAMNIALGFGGGLLQKHNRDSASFATKLCQITYANGTVRPIMKAPKTDTGKFSLPGRLEVRKVGDHKVVYPGASTLEDIADNLMITVYDCGPVAGVWDDSFTQTRQRVETEWNEMPVHADVLSEQLKGKIAKLMQA